MRAGQSAREPMRPAGALLAYRLRFPVQGLIVSITTA
jgi:hypothetical protein